MRICTQTHACWLLLALWLCCKSSSVCAQVFPHLTTQQFDVLYLRAYSLRKTPACLPMADSLIIAARTVGDHVNELHGLNIKLLYEYYQPDNIKGFESAQHTLQQRSLQYGIWEEYYRSVSNKVAYYIRQEKSLEGFLYLEKEEKFAKQNNLKEGIRWCIRMRGVLQQYRGLLSQAIGFFEQTIDYSRTNTPEHNVIAEYFSIADCYRMMGNYQKILETTEKCEPLIVNQFSRINTLAFRCYAQFMLGNREAFLSDYEYLQKNLTGLFISNEVMSKALKICKMIADGKDEEALKAITDFEKIAFVESHNLSIAYYRSKGEYLKATEHAMLLINSHYISERDLFESDQKSMDRIFRDHRIESERQQIVNENAEIELANVNLRLHNASLELDHSRDAAQLAKASAYHHTLNIEREQLKVRQLRDSLFNQQLEKDTHAQKAHIYSFALIIAIALSLIILITMVLYYYHKQRAANRLRNINNQLRTTIQQLNNAKKDAQESEQAKTIFIQNMSHEIRTPLNAIVGFAQVLAGYHDIEHNEKKNMARIIADNSTLLTTLVNDILDLTALENGDYQIAYNTTAVNELCRETIETIRQRKANGVTLRYETTLDDAYTTTTDSHRVKQVLINLLTNAEKNTEQGEIVVTTSLNEHPGMLTFCVTDTGCGVPTEKQEIIFQRFNKLDTFKQGTGLGLDICRTITTRLGGEINIDPTYTGGARFWFTIPVKP